MKLSQFKFKLPEEQIALYPHSIYHDFVDDNGNKVTSRITRRDECKLMVLHSKSQTIELYKKDADGNPIEGEYLDFRNVLDYFDEGDTFVFNDTKIFPARLYGTKEKTDAKIEVFLLRELNQEMRLWDVLVCDSIKDSQDYKRVFTTWRYCRLSGSMGRTDWFCFAGSSWNSSRLYSIVCRVDEFRCSCSRCGSRSWTGLQSVWYTD